MDKVTMEVFKWATIGVTVISSICAIVAAFCDSRVATKAVESIARQPEAKGSITMTMIIGIGLVESMPIIAIVIAFILLGIVTKLAGV